MLEDHGNRVQYSVFELLIDGETLDELIQVVPILVPSSHTPNRFSKSSRSD
jgi:CRISPR/Cas system-associated endoribonuclease Cas2